MNIWFDYETFICNVCGEEINMDEAVKNGLGEFECETCYYESLRKLYNKKSAAEYCRKNLPY